MRPASSPVRVHLLEDVLGDLAADGPVVDQRDEPRQAAGRDGRGCDRRPSSPLSSRRSSLSDPVGHAPSALRVGPHGLLEVVGERPSLREELGVVGGEAVARSRSAAGGPRAARAGRARSRPPRPGRAPAAPGRAPGSSGSRARTPSSASAAVALALGVPQPRLLHDALARARARAVCRATSYSSASLHVAEGVHVLDLDLRAELGRAGAAGARRWRRSGASPPPCCRRRRRGRPGWRGGSAGTRRPPPGDRRSGRETISMSGTPARL